MQCDICSKTEATVHLTEIVDGEMTKMHLCEDCAKKKGAEMEEHFGLGDLLAGLADLDIKFQPQVEPTVKCRNCGLTYADFKKIGRLGCGECYSTFEGLLSPLIKRIHGSVQHSGKAPTKAPTKVPTKAPTKASKVAVKAISKLQELRAKLQRAVKLEEFEEAAKLRDKIRQLEARKK